MDQPIIYSTKREGLPMIEYFLLGAMTLMGISLWFQSRAIIWASRRMDLWVQELKRALDHLEGK